MTRIRDWFFGKPTKSAGPNGQSTVRDRVISPIQSEPKKKTTTRKKRKKEER